MGRPFIRRNDRKRSQPDPTPRPKPQRKGPWKNGPLPVIGLVGGIGAGKSRVAAILEELGAHVIDADAVGHALIDQPPAREMVLERFGDEILDHSDFSGPPRVDRKRLGKIVFEEPGSLKALEAILHPRMRLTFEKAIARTSRRKLARAVVLDAAILFEARWHDLCDFVVYVDAPDEIRLQRLQESRGWNAEILAAREQAQMTAHDKKSRSDFLIENHGDLKNLTSEVKKTWGRMTRSTQGAKSVRKTPDPASNATDPS